MDQDRESRIRARAYALWEEKGRPDGGHEAHWRQAERELEEEEKVDGPAEEVGARQETPEVVQRKSSRRKP